MISRFGLVLVSVVLTTTAAGAQEVRFDRFLGGFLEGCRMGPDFVAFHGSIVQKYGSMGKRSARLVVADSVRPGIGTITTRPESESTRVVVPLTGSFGGLPLRQLVFSVGNENGINGWAVDFATDQVRLRERFGAAVVRSRKLLKAYDSEGIGFDTGFDFNNGRVALWCDMST